MKRLYVDDLRDAPHGWDVVRNFHKAIVMLEENEYDVGYDMDYDFHYDENGVRIISTEIVDFNC